MNATTARTESTSTATRAKRRREIPEWALWLAVPALVLALLIGGVAFASANVTGSVKKVDISSSTSSPHDCIVAQYRVPAKFHGDWRAYKAAGGKPIIRECSDVVTYVSR